MSHTIQSTGRCGRQVKPSALRCSTISVAITLSRSRAVVDRGDAQAAIHELPGPPPGAAPIDRALAARRILVALAFLEQHREGFGQLGGGAVGRVRGHARAGCHRQVEHCPGLAGGEPGGGGAGEEHVQDRQAGATAAQAAGLLERLGERLGEALAKPERCPASSVSRSPASPRRCAGRWPSPPRRSVRRGRARQIVDAREPRQELARKPGGASRWIRRSCRAGWARRSRRSRSPSRAQAHVADQAGFGSDIVEFGGEFLLEASAAIAEAGAGERSGGVCWFIGSVRAGLQYDGSVPGRRAATGIGARQRMISRERHAGEHAGATTRVEIGPAAAPAPGSARRSCDSRRSQAHPRASGAARRSEAGHDSVVGKRG